MVVFSSSSLISSVAIFLIMTRRPPTARAASLPFTPFSWISSAIF